MPTQSHRGKGGGWCLSLLEPLCSARLPLRIRSRHSKELQLPAQLDSQARTATRSIVRDRYRFPFGDAESHPPDSSNSARHCIDLVGRRGGETMAADRSAQTWPPRRANGTDGSENTG